MTSDSIAAELYQELGTPCENKPFAIAYWIRTNIGLLNNLLCVDFVAPATSSTEIVHADGSPMTEIEKAIFKQLYIVRYYDGLVRGSLGAASTDSTIEISSDGATVRRVNKNELSKTYLALKSSMLGELQALLLAYNNCNFIPLGVVGDDAFGSTYNNLCCPTRGRD